MAKKQEVGFKYFKLGPDASIFYDPFSKLKVVNNVPGKAPASKVTVKNKKVTSAKSKGHIQEIDEEEYNRLFKKYGPKDSTEEPEVEDDEDGDEEDEGPDFEAMSKAELDKFAEETLGMEGTELEEFKSLNKKGKLEKIAELTEE